MNSLLRTTLLLTLLACTLPGAGCMSMQQSWRRFFQRDTPIPQQAQIAENATLAEVVTVVNRNLERIQTFHTQDASISGTNMPATLRGEIAFRRPGLFRLRGSTGLTGAELDVGKNETLSWFWIRMWEPKGVYFCRNDQYAACEAVKRLPIDPNMMADALGLSLLDPSQPYDGPKPVKINHNGQDSIDPYHLALHLKERNAQGQTRTRIILINRMRGLPAAQQIYDQYERLVFEARVKTYNTDPDTGISTPQTLTIRCPLENNGKGMTLNINFGRYFINSLDPKFNWSMPAHPGYPPTDLMTLSPEAR